LLLRETSDSFSSLSRSYDQIIAGLYQMNGLKALFGSLPPKIRRVIVFISKTKDMDAWDEEECVFTVF